MAYTTQVTDNGIVHNVIHFSSKAQQIDDAVANMGAASTPQAALAALGAGVRPNLLDNAYFVGGGTGWGVFPVNQKGGSQYNSIGDTFDRWKSLVQGLVVDLNETGLSFSGSGTQHVNTFLSQKFKLTDKNLTVGDTVCLSVLIGNQLYTGFTQVPDNGIDSFIIICSDVLAMNLYSDQTGYAQFNFRIAGPVQEVKAAKLEIGSNQTLAYQDSNGNWQLLPQPDSSYGAQLLECLRYQVFYAGSTTPAISQYSNNYLLAVMWLPVPLRAVPVLASGTIDVFGNGASLSTKINGFAFEYFLKGNLLIIRAVKQSHGLTPATATIQLNAPLFSANL